MDNRQFFIKIGPIEVIKDSKEIEFKLHSMFGESNLSHGEMYNLLASEYTSNVALLSSTYSFQFDYGDVTMVGRFVRQRPDD